ncbi:MAG: glycosyltransferase family 4 protein [Candidatus Levybacteria bacterium]|nr:glycosyltransferase family 4 protein [Candidatus Levybacteria bacterium]
MINVLLVSPTDPKVSTNLKFLMSGENTYTKMLLKYRPKGVRYTYMTDALRKGEITYTFWQRFLTLVIQARILPPDPGYLCIRLRKKFDLIHCHAYSLKINGNIRPPVILSDSSSNALFLRDYIGWSPNRIRIYYWLRKFIHTSLGVYDKELHLDSCKRLLVFSKFARSLHIDLGADPSRISVVPPGLPKRVERRSVHGEVVNILFAGVWFERKGGYILLAAYRNLKKHYPKLRLILLGPLPKNVAIRDNEDIQQLNFVSYKDLTGRFYPSADIFVLVPPKVEGYGMVVLEAMSFGLPIIVSNVCALPELVEDGKTGFVVKPGSIESLTLALEKLIKSRSLRKRMSREARKRFLRYYNIDIMNKKLFAIYKKVIDD